MSGAARPDVSGAYQWKRARRFYLKLRALGIAPYVPADPEAPMVAYQPPLTGELLAEATPLTEELFYIVVGGRDRPGRSSLSDEEYAAVLREGGQLPGGREEEAV